MNTTCMRCGCYEHCHEWEEPTADGEGIGTHRYCEHCGEEGQIDGDLRPPCPGSEAGIADAIESDYRDALTFYPNLTGSEETRDGLADYGLLDPWTHEWTDLGARVAEALQARMRLRWHDPDKDEPPDAWGPG